MTKDALDVAGVALASNTEHVCSDVDVIGTRCLEGAGIKAQCDVVTTCCLIVAGEVADSCVMDAGGVVKERGDTVRRI